MRNRHIIKNPLNGYVQGTDGLFYKRQSFGSEVEIICRHPNGKMRYVQHLEASQVGTRIDCRTIFA